MGRATLCVPFALLFLASVIPSKAQSETSAVEATTTALPAGGAADELVYDVRSNITLHCTLPNDKSLPYVWKKNDTAVQEVEQLKGRYDMGGGEFRVHRSHEDDYGNYSCAVSGLAATQRWAVRGRPVARLPAHSNVVEGQKLKITCKVIGKPYPRVAWFYSNSSGGSFVDVASVLGERVRLDMSDAGVPDGALTLAAAARSDAGHYRCSTGVTEADTELLVKDMYAALWPFLGICAEVFVLCAIILVYEKRRTKPDLDDSDVDNNDQKKS